jgi:DEAD/DEAH box helicase domain-containing protein
MEEVLQHWDHLRPTSSDVDEAIGAEMVESHLEQRFLEKLRAVFGPDSLKPKLLEGSRRAFQLTVRKGTAPAHWTIETQVQMDLRFPRMPRKRVDFLLTPSSGQSALPIVVEMDGLAYHAKTATTDLDVRFQIIRSRKARVISLAWDDLADNQSGSVPNPFSQDRMGSDAADVMDRLLQLCDLTEYRPAVSLLQKASSWEGLMQLLKQPSMDLSQAAVALIQVAIGRGAELASLPRIQNISEDGKLFLEDGQRFGSISDRTVDFYFSAPEGGPKSTTREISAFRLIVRGALPKLNGEIVQNRHLSDAWRGLWRTVNFFQDLPGFHVEFEGLDSLAVPRVGAAAEMDRDDGWLTVEKLVDDRFLPLVRALQSADLPSPDCGVDVMSGDTVAGMFELAWRDGKVGISEDRFESSDWTCIHFNPDTDDLEAIVDLVIGSLGRTRP